MAKKVLITGGAGTIGYFLTKSLAEQGYEVTVVDNLVKGQMDKEMKKVLDFPNVKFKQIDITDPAQYKGLNLFDFIYHLAAINNTKFFYEKPEEILKMGILGAINILEWFKKQDKGKILFASSNEAYASYINLTGGPIPTPENIPLAIDDVTNPRWSYGGSKLAGELLFVNYARMNKFPASIIRYHNNYGPRMGRAHVIPEFILRIIKKEEPFKIFGASNTRTFCYITDTIRATQLIMESAKTDGAVVNIGNDKEEITMLDLAEKMFSLFGYRPKNLEINDAPAGSVLRRCPDLTKIKSLTGYEPQVLLEYGLKKTYDWYIKESA